MERNEQLKGDKQKQCWSGNDSVEDASSRHGVRWSCDLGEPSVGSQFPHLEKGEVSGGERELLYLPDCWWKWRSIMVPWVRAPS